MKKLLLFLMCATAMTATAQTGWIYGEKIALIKSLENYFTDDFDNPTYMRIIVGTDDDNQDVVMIGAEGYRPQYNFRANQEYIVVDFVGVQTKWAIEKAPAEDKPMQYFFVTSASKFIEALRQTDIFTISMPLLFHGTQTFYFSANGYPLDW